MAFDWIESHRGLRDHPKTVTLAAVWRDRKPCVLGHLHALWWWTLEYAPAGVIRSEFFPQVVSYCEWHGKPEQFWNGLQQAAFLESTSDVDGYVVHDWDEYAHRRIERHEKETARKRAWRDKVSRAGETGPDTAPDAPVGRRKPSDETSGATGPTRARHQPDQPETPTASPGPDLPPKPPSGDADAQGPAGPASARSPAEPLVVHADAGICPLCRRPYLGSYLDHTAESHKVRQEPDDLRSSGRGPMPDEVRARLKADPIPEVPA